MGAAQLRHRDQLRGRRPVALPDGAVARARARRVRHGGRRAAADPSRRVRSHATHGRERAGPGRCGGTPDRGRRRAIFARERHLFVARPFRAVRLPSAPRPTLPRCRRRFACRPHSIGRGVSLEVRGRHGLAGHRPPRKRRTRDQAVAARAIRRGRGRLAARPVRAVLLTGAPGNGRLVDRARAALPPGRSRRRRRRRRHRWSTSPRCCRCAACTSQATRDRCTSPPPSARRSSPSSARRTRARYAPLVRERRIVQIHETLPCAPCNRIRLPPERCRGIVPDCLSGLGADLGPRRRAFPVGRGHRPGVREVSWLDVTVSFRRGGVDPTSAARRLPRAHGRGDGRRGSRIAWIKAIRSLAGGRGVTSATASRTTATRSGGSRSCSSTRRTRSRAGSRPWPRSTHAIDDRIRPRRPGLEVRGRLARTDRRRRRAHARSVLGRSRRPGARTLPPPVDGGPARPVPVLERVLVTAAPVAPPVGHGSHAGAALPRSCTGRSGGAARATARAKRATSARSCRRLDISPGGRLQLVGVGPRTNFRARRWWHAATEPPDRGPPFRPGRAPRAPRAPAAVARRVAPRHAQSRGDAVQRATCRSTRTSRRRPLAAGRARTRRHRVPAVPVVGARPWTKPERRWTSSPRLRPSPTRKRAAGGAR